MLFLFILLELFFASSEGKHLEYPVGSDWKTINGSDNAYYISHAALSWIGALRYCSQRGAHLASLESKKEEAELFNLIPAADKGRFEYWTSGTNIVKNEFTWMATGRPFNGNYFNFCTADLLTLWNDNHCVVANDRRNCWQTQNCGSPLRFICEIRGNVFLE